MAEPRRGLGRGLGALIPAADESASAVQVDATYLEVDPNDIVPNPRQPRQVFDEDAMAELVFSVREIGLLQPVVVRRRADGPPFELIAGERRWRACQEAGLTAIPVIVRETTDDNLLREALLENLHRAQLNPLEEAAAYQQLLADFGGTQEELAQRLGRSRPQVANTLRLLKLPPGVQRRVAAGVISAGHARALLSLEDPDQMENLAERIVAEGLSVRSTEEIVLLGDDGEPRRKRSTRNRSTTSPQMAELADEVSGRLADRLDTRVRVEGAKNVSVRGRLVIEFADAEDLRRIVELLD